jgi:hypothetical protein
MPGNSKNKSCVGDTHMRAKKAKAWRGHMSAMEHQGPDVRRLGWSETGNCTVIPDGATVPLPASVRRELETLRRLADVAYGLSLGTDWNNGTMAKTHGYRRQLVELVQEYRSATKAKGKKS